VPGSARIAAGACACDAELALMPAAKLARAVALAKPDL